MAIHVSVLSAWTGKFVANHRRLMIAIVVVSLASSTTYAAESGKARSESHTLAVITHGFRTPGERGSPEWAFTLKDFLEQQGCRCVVTDWAAESNDAAPGWAESAGDEVFVRLIWEANRSEAPLTLHLIGYSRGAVVNSEAQRRLAWWSERQPTLKRSFAEVKVTLLDPHAANEASEFSTNSEYLGLLARKFAERAADPPPVLWRNTTAAYAFFQRAAVAAAPEPVLNPLASFVQQESSVGVLQLRDVTGIEFNLHATTEDAPRVMNHEAIPHWFCEAIRMRPQGGIDLAPTPSEECPSMRFVSHSTRADSAERPGQPDFLFNGDFRYDGNVEGLLFRLCAERMLIPGWTGSGRFHVTPDQRLRLSPCGRASEPAVAWVVHNPMFFPPTARTLEWEAHSFGGADAAELRAYFVPVSLAYGELRPETSRSAWRMLGRWSGDEVSAIGPALSVRVPPSDDGVGAVGAVAFELLTPADAVATIELDNVQFNSTPLLANGDR